MASQGEAFLQIHIEDEGESDAVIDEIVENTGVHVVKTKVFKILPIYKLISNTGPRHKPLFKVAVKLKNTKFFTAQGVSKKDAQQNAAALCLESTP